MMVIPVMVTATPRELETIGTITIWNSGETTHDLTRYKVTWSDEHGVIKEDVWHNPDDGAMPLIAQATEKLKRGPKV